MSPLILVCSSDAEFCLLMQHILKAEGFESAIAENVQEAIQQVDEGNVSAVILDCQPGSNLAPAICAQIKLNQTDRVMPIVALITPGSKDRYLELLKAGVDQAFVRPIAPQWLLAYLHTILASEKDESMRPNANERVITFGEIQILTDKYRVHRGDGKEIRLSPIEYKLLCAMLRMPGQVFSREDLIRAAWPENIFVSLRTVDVHIGRLRRLLAKETGTNFIRTVRSAGYAVDAAN